MTSVKPCRLRGRGALLRAALLMFLLCVPLASPRAELLVLVPGFLGDASDWRDTGITAVLERGGWSAGGHLSPLGGETALGAGGARLRYFTVSLPTGSSLATQLVPLRHYLARLRAVHPDDSLILVGHSAGGVLARLYMVRHPDSGVAALVTIASPHGGTDRADLGTLAAESPLGWFAPLFDGGTLQRARGLLRELRPARPGTFLHWLNHQVHPPARYISVVRRADPRHGVGDVLVPLWSQDMNQVPALRGRAERVESVGLHSLRARDGDTILRVLRYLRTG